MQDWDERRAIEDCKDAAQLQKWFAEYTINGDDTKIQIEAHREAMMSENDEWYYRAANALKFNRLRAKWCERRLLELGAEVPDLPEHPLAIRNQQLGQQLYEARQRISQMKRQLERIGEATDA